MKNKILLAVFTPAILATSSLAGFGSNYTPAPIAMPTPPSSHTNIGVRGYKASENSEKDGKKNWRYGQGENSVDLLLTDPTVSPTPAPTATPKPNTASPTPTATPAPTAGPTVVPATSRPRAKTIRGTCQDLLHWTGWIVHTRRTRISERRFPGNGHWYIIGDKPGHPSVITTDRNQGKGRKYKKGKYRCSFREIPKPNRTVKVYDAVGA